MSKMQSAILRVSVILIALNVNLPVIAAGSGNEMDSAALAATGEMQLTLSAAHRTTSYDDRVSKDAKFDLPLLHLHRERGATEEADRTLDIEIAGLPVEAEIQIEAISLHADVSTGERHRAAIRFVSPDQPCTTQDPCQVRWTFDASKTPSDLYELQVKSEGGELIWSNPYRGRPDFVMLDTWDAAFEEYTVRVYYAALFPFAKGSEDLDNRLSPAEVTNFIEEKFVPMVVDIWNTQVHEWGFGEPFHPDWDADHLVEIIMTAYPFALFDGTGTYTVFVNSEGHPFPERRIWWLPTHGSLERYDSMENGCKVILAHEFFHLMQWNVLLSTGHPTNFRISMIEPQGRLAPNVQYPELELTTDHIIQKYSGYTRIADRFLTQHLNTSYTDFEVETHQHYDAALYWQFLYEQYQDMSIFRAPLEEMAHHFNADIVVSMGRAMDGALARLDGPFDTFEDSLVAFARANYALRLENGRCPSGEPECAGKYYDPDEMYTDPVLDAWINYKGGTWTYDGIVPVSYGMDFLEVSLDPDLQSQPVTVTFQSEGAVSRFNVQVWELGGGRPKPRSLTAQPETVLQNEADAPIQAILHLDRTKCHRLAFIVTRLDSNDTVRSAGGYRITLESAVESDDDQDTVIATVPVVGDDDIAW